MKKRPLLCCAVVLILWICIDFFFHSEKDTSFLGREGQNILCEGIIDKMEYKSDGQLQIELVHVQSEFLDAVARSDKVQVILKEPARCALGNRVRVQGKQSGLDIPSNDGQFDRLFYQKSNKILFTIKQAKLLVLDDHTYPIRQFLFLTRNQCRQKFLQVFQQEDAGVLAAMLLGDKTELTDEIKDWYQLGGISHILAISGVKTLKLGIPLVPETRINWAFVPLHIAIIYILKLCLDEEIIPRCRFPCSRGYLTNYINWQKKQ